MEKVGLGAARQQAGSRGVSSQVGGGGLTLAQDSTQGTALVPGA